jgi:hypothetical protein
MPVCQHVDGLPPGKMVDRMGRKDLIDTVILQTKVLHISKHISYASAPRGVDDFGIVVMQIYVDEVAPLNTAATQMQFDAGRSFPLDI